MPTPTNVSSSSPTRGSRWGRRAAVVAIVALAGTFTAIGPPPASAAPIAAVPLGLVSTFAVLTPGAVGNTATTFTVLRGDVGVGGLLTGFPEGIYTGALYEGAAVDPALADLRIAFDDANARTGGAVMPAELGGTTAGPGVHTSAAAVGMAAGGTFTIDAQGDADAVFIFQVNGAFTLGANTTINLTGGARAENVYWAVTGAGDIGADSKFAGTLIATNAVSSGAVSTVNGRLTSLGGAITMDSTDLYSSPPTVTIDGGENASSMTSAPTISGSTSLRSPSTVSVTVDGAAVTPEPALSETGAWSFKPGLLANGGHTIVASVVDGAGNVDSFTQILNVDTIPPAVTIDGGETAATRDTDPTITGTTDVAAGQVVTITATRTDQSVTLNGTALVQADQTWNLSPNGFTPGDWTIVAGVTDPAGNPNTATQTLTIDTQAPTAAITSATLTNDATPTITGNTEAGATVTVAIDGHPLTDVTVTDTNWSATVTAGPLSDGDHQVAVSATDPVGNTGTTSQTLTVDTVAPPVTIDPGEAEASNNTTPTITGTAEVANGATITITIGAGEPMSALVETGTWNVTPATPLDPRTYTITATVADPAGNTGTGTQQLTIDTTAPVVTIHGGVSRTSFDPTPTLTGSATGATPGSKVTVTVDGQTLTTTITADETFAVTAARLNNGSHVVSAAVTDTAGNTGNANQSLTIDAVQPSVTINGGLSASTKDATPTIAGATSADAGAAVTVTVAGQTLHAFVQPGGSWNVTAAHIDNSTVTVDGSITDAYGNTGTATQTLIVDTTTPPTTPTVAALTSVGSVRVFDTRADSSPDAVRAVTKRQVGGTDELRVQLTDISGYVPASGVSAVSLNVTVTRSNVAGFVTVYACGTRETVSSVNFAAGQTVANAVIAPVAADGSVCFYASTPTDVIVDINGWLPIGAAFSSVGPKRVFDTRAGSSPDALRTVATNKIAADNMMEVRLTDLAGYVPTSGVGSVSLNVVVTNPEAAGYVTVYACGTRAEVSSVNYVAGQTVANAVIVPVSATGTVCFYTLAATHLVVDINGWFTAGAGFNGINPARVLDTRAGSSPDALRDVPHTKIGGGYVLDVDVTDLPGRVPADDVTGVSLNVTATNTEGPGFITVFACGTRNEVSSLNFNTAGQTVANAVITPVSATGTICLYSNQLTDVIVDINGWIGASSS